jgi:hypothetical protein
MERQRKSPITVKELIEELKKYPSDAIAYAYEGEAIGIMVTDKNGGPLGEILTCEPGSRR